MNRYVAFQLGINVGKRQVKMVELRELLEENGYSNVRTLLASGNVVFESDEVSLEKLTEKLDVLMTKHFGFAIKNIVRKFADIKKLVASDPFKHIAVTPLTRLYITFLSDKPITQHTIPHVSPDGGFVILFVTSTEVISYKTLSENSGTTDAMKILVQEFGKNITTRNWNTVKKIAAIY